MGRNPCLQRPIVFLDIDDVLCVNPTINLREVHAALHSDANAGVDTVWKQVFDVSARKNLRQLHEEFSPFYVISSSWVLDLSKQQFCEVFSKTKLEFVHENLHEIWCTPRSADSYRMTEIETWLDSHAFAGTSPVLILDDDLSGQSLVGSHLEAWMVLCEAMVGFVHPKLVVARTILLDQLKRSR